MYSEDLIKKINFIVNHPNIRYVIYPGGTGGERLLTSLIYNVPSYSRSLDYYRTIEYFENFNRFNVTPHVFVNYYIQGALRTSNTSAIISNEMDCVFNNSNHIFQHICTRGSPHDRVEENIDKLVSLLENGSMFPIRAHPYQAKNVNRYNVPQNSYCLGTANEIDDTYSANLLSFKVGLGRIPQNQIKGLLGSISNETIDSLYKSHSILDEGLLRCISLNHIKTEKEANELLTLPAGERASYYRGVLYSSDHFKKIREKYSHNLTYITLTDILKNEKCQLLESQIGETYAQSIINDMKIWHQLNLKAMKKFNIDYSIFEDYYTPAL